MYVGISLLSGIIMKWVTILTLFRPIWLKRIYLSVLVFLWKVYDHSPGILGDATDTLEQSDL
jgi:hypothetical protein